VQDEKAMTKQAKQRLEAIQMEELGSGFFLAMHDLEIRGAGEVLGDNQSGEMQEVGFNLFTDMLNRAVAHLKQGKAIDTVDLTQPLGITTEINLRTPALLPDAYCPDVHERLTLYKRLANCETAEDIDTPAGRADRPLRRTAAAGPVAARHAPPAHPGQTAVHPEAGCLGRPDH
jgi:transcription-repair coupling factor (superfamily II helicase)